MGKITSKGLVSKLIKLTPRQMEFARLVAADTTQAAMAEQLGLQITSVKGSVARLYRNLNLPLSLGFRARRNLLVEALVLYDSKPRRAPKKPAAAPAPKAKDAAPVSKAPEAAPAEVPHTAPAPQLPHANGTL